MGRRFQDFFLSLREMAPMELIPEMAYETFEFMNALGLMQCKLVCKEWYVSLIVLYGLRRVSHAFVVNTGAQNKCGAIFTSCHVSQVPISHIRLQRSHYCD